MRSTLLTFFILALAFGAANGTDDEFRVPVISGVSESDKHADGFVLSDRDLNNERYLRHRAVRIDTESLRSMLDADLRAYQTGEVTEGVPLPLFADLTVRVRVNSTSRSEFHEATGYSGHELGGISFFSTFTDAGYFKMVVRTTEKSYIIEKQQGSKYFVVIALKKFDGPID